MFKLRPYQTDMVRRNEECWAAGIKNPVSVLPTGAGKCYRKGTMIIMSDGKRKAVEDIVVGDRVMGPDSKPRNVLALGRGSEMMYEVMPTKGEPYYVNESHILSLRSPHHDQVVNIPLLEALKKPATFWHDHQGWRVPNILMGDTTYELVAIRHVRSVGVEPYYGFMLDGDHLHLLGDCTVSHNTVIASEIIRREQERDGYFAAIAHRQELVSQISLALARQGVMHDVVAPRAVRRFCGDLHNKELGRCFVSTKANGFVGGVDTIVRRDLGRLKDRVSLMFQDECFPAGTLITMHDGSTKPIEDVQVGDRVIAYDEDADRLIDQRVYRLFKNPAPREMVAVGITTHHVLICTKGHPFYTRRGWVPAAELTTNDEVLYDHMDLHPVQPGYLQHQRGAALPLAEDWQNILRQGLQQKVRQGKPQTPKTGTSTGSTVHPVRAGSGLNVLAVYPLEGNGARVLQSPMCKYLPVSGFQSHGGGNEPEIRVKEDAGKKPDAQHQVPRENVPNLTIDRTPTYRQGWKRARSNSSRKSINGVTGALRIPAAGCGSDFGMQPAFSDAETLQDRLCERTIKDSDRSGWSIPPSACTSGTRPTQRRGFKFTRLESVSIFEQDDTRESGDGFVYNIEVRGVHTYVADGVVVHNCHHVLADNKWGKAAAMFPRANGLFVTATPCRADGKGLGRHADGLFDTILEGPTMREIIRMGSLTDYKIYAPPSNIDLTNVAISRATGDYNQTQLQNESKRQRRGIVGNVVRNYIDYTPNTQCVAFVVDVATAMQTADEFNAQGIPTVALSANNTDAERHEAITKFKNGEIKVIVNVDLLGEGFDCPAIESVIMARPTMSYGLYCQQFGRALRLLDGKKFGIVVDMVGNVKRHGLPDAPRQWSLDRSERKGGGADDTRPIKVCPECTGAYEVGPTRCPYCGYAAVVAPGEAGGGLIEVDAGLRELTAEELAEMRGEIDKLGREWHTAPGMSKQQYIQFSQHNKTVRSQKRLRDAIAYYAGACKSVGMDDRGIHVQFTTLYGTSITEAQLLRPKDADALSDRIESDLVAMGVDRAVG